MKRAEFDHAIRAAGSILGETEILVIGSQAIHGSISGDLPAEAQRSIEVDIVAFDDADARKADLIDGSIGEASALTNGVVAWCLDLHDLWLAKAVAGRPKDYEFCRALANKGLVDQETLQTRLGRVPDLADAVRVSVSALIESTSQSS